MTGLGYGGNWAATTAASMAAPVLAQSLPVPETPTSVLVAFIAVSMSALGLLGWVLRESLSQNRAYARELARLNEKIAKIHERMGIREGKDHDDKD